MTCNYWSWCVCACMFVCFCLFFYFSLFCFFLLNYHFVKIHCTHLSTIEFSFCLTNPKIELILSHLVKNFNLFGSYCNNLLLVLSIAGYLLKNSSTHVANNIHKIVDFIFSNKIVLRLPNWRSLWQLFFARLKTKHTQIFLFKIQNWQTFVYWILFAVEIFHWNSYILWNFLCCCCHSTKNITYSLQTPQFNRLVIL